MLAVETIRRGLWHLRQGGVSQLREFRFRHRHGDASAVRRGAQSKISRWPLSRTPRFAEADRVVAQPAQAEVRAGVVLDDFSLAGFEWEWTCVPLTPGTTPGELRGMNLDLVFIESAWNANNGIWRYKLLGSDGPGAEIQNLINSAKDLGLPVVLWNKEDPPHYEDFLPLARLCDYVFTTDINKVADYRADLGHANVDCLAFAAQPRIHNPVRPRRGWQQQDVAFAGMYFAHKYPERREQMDVLLPAAADACATDGYRFDIFSRELGKKADYQFPQALQKHVVGSLNYRQMLTAYEAYKVFLNVNSVVGSNTMCSRRVFEMTAAGATVVTTTSPAMTSFFPDGELPIIESAAEATNVIRAVLKNRDYAQRLVHRAQRRIWSEHTYSHRAQQILSAVRPDLALSDTAPLVSVLVPSFRPEQLDHVIAGLASQRTVAVELLYGAHGFDVDGEEVQRKCHQAGLQNVKVMSFPRSKSLGECLNSLAAEATGAYAAKWDDDDLYGPWYLHDQLHALSYSGATVVGKRAHYMMLKGPDVVVLRNSQFEHRFTHFVAGPTLVARLQTFLDHPFPAVNRGEDSGFLRNIMGSGGSIYAADRFNYRQFRGIDESKHTWQISSAELLATSEVKFFGDSEEQIFV